MAETAGSYDPLRVYSSIPLLSVLSQGSTVVVDPNGTPAYWSRVEDGGWELDRARYGEPLDPTPWSTEELVAYYSTGRDGREFSYAVEEMGEED